MSCNSVFFILINSRCILNQLIDITVSCLSLDLIFTSFCKFFIAALKQIGLDEKTQNALATDQDSSKVSLRYVNIFLPQSVIFSGACI